MIEATVKEIVCNVVADARVILKVFVDLFKEQLVIPDDVIPEIGVQVLVSVVVA